jgi:DNA-3-methyladenine glycosylase
VKTLSQSFYSRPTFLVACELLGARLVRILNGKLLSGIITETEAYIGEDDLGCHAKSGRTNRNAIMYGPPGHAYIYFTYGMHWMLNAVTEPEGVPAAVLLRAIEPVDGLETIRLHRNGGDTIGPAKLTQAFGIDGTLNGTSLFNPESGLWIEIGTPPEGSDIISGPRVGLNTVPEPWKSIPWRFRLQRR